MQVQEIIEITTEWINKIFAPQTGLVAAHLMGSLPHLPRHAEFPPYRDVDVHLIWADAVPLPAENLEVSYRGLMIEAGHRHASHYATPEIILADPVIAPHMAVDSVLFDPTGFLRKRQIFVEREFAYREWVQARVEAEKQKAYQAFDEASAQDFPPARVLMRDYAIVCTAATLSLAVFQPVTGRRSFIKMKEILYSIGCGDLYEALLSAIGLAHFTRTEVEGYLASTVRAFDLALQVKQSPAVPFGHKFHSHLRPYLVEATQEMIDEGYHREALGWIGAYYGTSMLVFQNDAPDLLTPNVIGDFLVMMHQRGMNDPLALDASFMQTRDLMSEIFAVADTLIVQNPVLWD